MTSLFLLNLIKMALTASNPMKIGYQAPAFEIYDTITDKIETLNSLKGKNGTVIMFLCNHCPFVQHVNHQLVQLAHDYMTKEIGFIAISSNDILTHPMDAPEYMKQVAIKEKYPFPYLYDATQDVAKAYDAACTPDFYIFDKNLKAVYHGQLDDSRPGNGIKSTGKDIRNALDFLLEGRQPMDIQKPSIGCNIKWKK